MVLILLYLNYLELSLFIKMKIMHVRQALDPFQYYRIFKIFEKFINFRLIEYLLDHHVICKHQFGLQKSFSTSDAIVEYLDCVYDTIHNKKRNVTKYFVIFLYKLANASIDKLS